MLAAVVLIVAALLWQPVRQPNVAAREPDRTRTPTAAPVPTAAPAPTATPVPTLIPVAEGSFELPIRGATGFAAVEMNLRDEPSPHSKLLRKIRPGEAFRILSEIGGYWRVESDRFKGWLAHKYCMINLPDVVPSIVYENTNASKSRVKSSGKSVPGITGERLYESQAFDERLGREVFIMPVIYAMAKKVCAAQRAALREGRGLKIYEAYRPASAQRAMVRALEQLADADTEVMRGISRAPWKMSWFISLGTSNHQRGCAIDASLVKVETIENRFSGGHQYSVVLHYEECAMPTPIHELSIASAAFDAPVDSVSVTAWRNARPTKAMNEEALSLQRYATDAGLTPLASEWWHFNDLQTLAALAGNAGHGDFVLSTLYSVAP